VKVIWAPSLAFSNISLSPGKIGEAVNILTLVFRSIHETRRLCIKAGNFISTHSKTWGSALGVGRTKYDVDKRTWKILPPC